MTDQYTLLINVNALADRGAAGMGHEDSDQGNLEQVAVFSGFSYCFPSLKYACADRLLLQRIRKSQGGAILYRKADEDAGELGGMAILSWTLAPVRGSECRSLRIGCPSLHRRQSMGRGIFRYIPAVTHIDGFAGLKVAYLELLIRHEQASFCYPHVPIKSTPVASRFLASLAS